MNESKTLMPARLEPEILEALRRNFGGSRILPWVDDLFRHIDALTAELTACETRKQEYLEVIDRQMAHRDALTAEVAALRSKLQEFSNEAHKLFVRSANSLVTPESLAEMLRETPHLQ